MQRCFHRRQDIAMHVYQSHVRRNGHWVYHRDYTVCDFDPIPSESCIPILCEATPDRVTSARLTESPTARNSGSQMLEARSATRIGAPEYCRPTVRRNDRRCRQRDDGPKVRCVHCQHDPKSGESVLRGLAVNLVRVLWPQNASLRGCLSLFEHNCGRIHRPDATANTGSREPQQ